MSCTMIKNQPFNKLSVAGKSMHHMHDFYHVQVNWFLRQLDDAYCIYNNIN